MSERTPPATPGFNPAMLVVGLFAVAILVWGLVAGSRNAAPAGSNNVPASSFQPGATVPAESSTQAAHWGYTATPDELHGGVVRQACAASANKVSQEAPYEDAYGALCVRQRPGKSPEAFFQLVGDGQLLCSGADGCEVTIRFDARPAMRFSGLGSADDSSNIFFIAPARRVLDNLRRSHVAKVEVHVYQAGDQVITFNTDGLQWPPSRAVGG